MARLSVWMRERSGRAKAAVLPVPVCAPDEVPSGDDVRDRLGLDGGGRFVPNRQESLHDGFGEAQFGEDYFMRHGVVHGNLGRVTGDGLRGDGGGGRCAAVTGDGGRCAR